MGPAATLPGSGALVDLPAFIDGQPVGPGQLRLLLICAAVLFVDGFDTQAIGYVAPALARDWNLPRGALGPVFSASLVGLMLGALLLGPLADRVGRKRIIVLSTAGLRAGHAGDASLPADATSLLLIRFPDRAGAGRRHAERGRHDGRVQPAPAPGHDGDGDVLRLLGGGGARRADRRGPDPCLRLAVRVPGRRGGAAAAVPGAGGRACRSRCGSSPCPAARTPRIAATLGRLFPQRAFRARHALRRRRARGCRASRSPHLFGEGRGGVTRPVLGRVLHEPARPLFPVELAADGFERPRARRCPSRAAVGAMLQVGGVAADLAARAADGPVLVPRPGPDLCSRPRWRSSSIGLLQPLDPGLRRWRSSAPGSASWAGRPRPTRWRPRSTRRRCGRPGVGWALGMGRVGSIVGPLVGGCAAGAALGRPAAVRRRRGARR